MEHNWLEERKWNINGPRIVTYKPPMGYHLTEEAWARICAKNNIQAAAKPVSNIGFGAADPALLATLCFMPWLCIGVLPVLKPEV